MTLLTSKNALFLAFSDIRPIQNRSDEDTKKLYFHIEPPQAPKKKEKGSLVDRPHEFS